ncbi:MAG: alpha/beta hydrolase [Bacteroidetes bacterium CG12_big_fil_rev_8_21_14_0_65_60_17]|nr:MAG: alpha/beta hydrolase [Bacteroidetes bacterium CG12_big_fil_rev_8_21_14_0_65_60_17]
MKLFAQISEHQGGTDARDLIILHGLLGASGNWRTLSRNVFSKHFRTIAVDLRNHGRSPHSRDMTYAVMADDVVELMNSMDIERAHVLGHSMGGKVAMTLALAHGSRVDRLVVADIAPKAYAPDHAGILEVLSAVDPASYTDRDAIELALAQHIPSAAVRQFLMKNLDRDGNSYRWKMNLPAISDAYDHIRGDIEARGTFPGKTLFVAGGASGYLDASDMLRVRARFPDARLHVLPGVGHWVHAEAPDAFSEAVLSFLTPASA